MHNSIKLEEKKKKRNEGRCARNIVRGKGAMVLVFRKKQFFQSRWVT